jgi:hypothetical protein
VAHGRRSVATAGGVLSVGVIGATVPSMKTLTLPCRCGAVELTVRGEPLVQMYCHCDDCQAVHGGAYVPESVYPASAVEVTRGTPSTWKLKRSPRFTCTTCGTRLFIEVLPLGLRGVNGYLLPAEEWKPTLHMQCQFAVRPVKDDLPHFKGRPARFAGSDETVDW